MFLDLPDDIVGILSATDEKKQDPDPEVSGTDPRIRIRTKMSWIHNIG